MWKVLDSIVKRIIEGPSSPLTRLQAFTLQSKYIEGLEMKPDARSLRNGTDPRMLYAFYNGMYIGTAYGDSFDVSQDVKGNPQVAGIVEMIHEAYLSVSPEEQARRDAEDEMYDGLVL
jgi:hypothetical protein